MAKPKIYVETGYMHGESAQAVCIAMENNGFGAAYTIEPNIDPNGLKHPRMNIVHGYSTEKMVEIFKKVGPFDMFLHDSNHGIWCMTFELELAWSLVRPDGVIACDDWTWGNPLQDAWRKFTNRHHVDWKEIGSCAYCIKPNTEENGVPWYPGGSPWADEKSKLAKDLADKEDADYVKAIDEQMKKTVTVMGIATKQLK